ncbi:MAG: PBP1A family penicillin-binding protein [Selenomonadaceae bacterium]|nr:PBP1A family penicillin-binding protein [Selenomonadaceae bacterium]
MGRTDINRGEVQNPPPHTPKKKSSTFLKIFVGLIIFVIVMAVGVGIGFVTANLNVKADLSKDILPPASSHIYDSAGNEIAIIHATENRVPVKIEQIPLNLLNAFVSIEDNRFYEHKGVDFRGLVRAAYTNLVRGEIAEGGSTITQQLAKNAYLTQERTIKRKIQEVFLALQLEKQYTKQEILELYLNQIYFGQGAYGVQAAAKTYFGKNVEDLTLAECAMLAGIPKSPNYYSPFNNINAAIERRDTVLDQMVTFGYITYSQCYEAKKSEVVLAPPNVPEKHKDAMYFIEYVTQLLVDRYGADAVYKEGLKVYTTIDLDMQKMAEEALLIYLPEYFTDENGILQPQGAIVAVEPKTGYIRAMVGGRGTDQFNRATMAERQPGSAFKPFVFVAGLENGYTPDTIIEDSPITIDDWSPQNYSRRFSGNVTLRTVAIFSMNVPTVKIAQALGIDKAIYYAQEMGISTFVLEGDPSDTNLAASLGGLTRGVTPLEIASAYGTFANNGIHIPHIAITKVLDRNGNIIYESNSEGRQVISPESAADLTSMLEDVIIKGTGKGAAIGRPAAGKTGTTSDYHDAWFVGYTPDLVASVWIGCDDNSETDGITGGDLPATIWSHFMQNALLNVPPHDFDELVVDRRNKKNVITEVRDNNSSRRRDYYDESESRSNYNEPEPTHYNEPEPSYYEPATTYRDSESSYHESEPDYSRKPEGVPDYTPEPEPIREPEPVYHEPEPVYHEPEPVYHEPEPVYNEPPAPVTDNAPSFDDELSKGRN